MKPLVRFLSALYPRRWRERYGEEFAALLDGLDPSPRTALNVFAGALSMQIRTWSFRSILAVSALCAIAAFAAEYALVPGRYVSGGVLMTTGHANSEQAVDAIFRLTQTVESRATLAKVIDSEHLYEGERSRQSLDDVLYSMRSSIRVTPTAAQNSSATFVVSFSYPDAAVAERAAQALISQYVAQAFADRVTLRVLDPAKLPTFPIRSLAKLATLALLFGLLVLGVLVLLRRRALKKA